MPPGRSINKFAALAACATAAVTLLGCQQKPAAAPRQPLAVTVRGASSPEAAARGRIDSAAVDADPCAARLQEISGALLEYYAIHSALPKSLDELQSLPDLDRPLTFACPGSSKPFVYVPGGLTSPADQRVILLYDPRSDTAGMRWVILMRRPTGRQTAAAWAERLSDATFLGYAPAAQPTTATRPSTGK